jgi:hypothetical protein
MKFMPEFRSNSISFNIAVDGPQGRREGNNLTSYQGSGIRIRGRKLALGRAILGVVNNNSVSGDSRENSRGYAKCLDYGLNSTIETARSIETINKTYNNRNEHVIEVIKTSSTCRIRFDKVNINGIMTYVIVVHGVNIHYDVINEISISGIKGIMLINTMNWRAKDETGGLLMINYNDLNNFINSMKQNRHERILYQGGGEPPNKPNKSDKVPGNLKSKRMTDRQLRDMARKSLQLVRNNKVGQRKSNNQAEQLPTQLESNTAHTITHEQRSAATNRFENHENMIIREGHGLTMFEVNQVKNNPTEYMYGNQVQALIRLFAMNSDRRIAVVSTVYTEHMLLRNFVTFRDYNPLNIDFQIQYDQPYYFDDNHDLANEISTVIIPVVLNQHFAVAMYEAGDTRIHYFDSLNWTLQDEIRQALIHAIKSLTGNDATVYPYHSNEGKHNHQNDGIIAYTCGIHAAINAESWIFNNKQLFKPNLNIIRERTRMIQILEELTKEKIPRYIPFGSLNNRESENTSKRTEQMRNYISQRRSNPEYRKCETTKYLEARKRRRQNSDLRTDEKEKNTVAHKQKREDQEYRKNEQAKDTKAHRNKRKSNKATITKILRNKGRRRNMTAKLNELDNVELYRLSEFNTECIECEALHFNEEKTHLPNKSDNAFTDCCGKGGIKLEPHKYPDELKQLFQNKPSREFYDNIRKYNTLPSYASMSCNKAQFDRHGPYCYKIHGNVYTQINQSARTEQGTLPRNGQLYFVDSAELKDIYTKAKNDKEDEINTLIKDMAEMKATENYSHQTIKLKEAELSKLREEHADIYWGCNPTKLFTIVDYVRENNPYAKMYMTLKEILDEQRTNYPDQNNAIAIRFVNPYENKKDPNRYNPPATDEVGAVFTMNADDEIPQNEVLIREKANGPYNLKSIPRFSKHIEPLTYVLLFPNGTTGWHYNYLAINGEKVTLAEYLRYMQSVRVDEEGDDFNAITCSKKLFQQYIVDMTVRMEQHRLEYIKKHQTELKAYDYTGLSDFLERRSNLTQSEIGTIIVLPSSFHGGPRYMKQRLEDAIAINNEFGNPDLFITFTCNPEHPDIIKCLREGESTNDRPDIVARVFRLQLKQFMKEMIQDGIFGKIIAHIKVIEFQKRGLPHAHVLFTLDQNDKFMTYDDIDDVIRAEIPDSNTEPELYKLVTEKMMHGPCGENNPNAPCMREKNGVKKCRFNFPHEFTEKTELKEDGHVNYRRRNNGNKLIKTVNGKQIELDNRWVAAYNPYLLLRFGSHINVERVGSTTTIKYLYKYVFKGHDAAVIQLERTIDNQRVIAYDEIAQYIEGRYLGPVEAEWRVNEYAIQQRSHSVIQLAVHDEYNREVVAQVNADMEELKKALTKDSKLIAAMKLKQENKLHDCMNVYPRNLLYVDIPKYYTWDNKLSKWRERKKESKTIGRIYGVSPMRTNEYYIRLLLTRQTNYSSYAELRTVDGQEYPSYREACTALGLIKNDDEWRACLNEACMFKFGPAIRSLFAIIMVHCHPSNPLDLWNEFKDRLSEDISHRYDCSQEHAYNLTLYDIDRTMKSLTAQEKTLSSFGLPMYYLSDNEMPTDTGDQINFDYEQEQAENIYERMTQEQQAIYNHIKRLIDEPKNTSKCIFIDGPGGSGKSFTLKAIDHYVRSQGKTICNMSGFGVAANELRDGRTVHNRFGLEVPCESNTANSRIKVNSKAAKDIIATNVFIWDEAASSSKYMINCVERKLKELMGNDLPMGGKIVIFAGDFRQTLPIKKHSNRSEQISLSMKRSDVWVHCKQFALTKNLRAKPEEKEFTENLMHVGNGTTVDENGEIELPPHCIVQSDLADEIYGECIQKKDYQAMTKYAILSPYNEQVDVYNRKVLDMMEGDIIPYRSVDSTIDSKHEYASKPEILNQLNSENLPAHKLEIKQNCTLMLIRNLNVKKGLSNGTRLRLLNARPNVLKCIILTGNHAGDEVLIPRITITDDSSFVFKLSRHQFPVKLAFAMTIHKAQAQTIERLGGDLTKDVFAHGQLYVLMSRVREWNGLKIKLDDDNTERRVVNIVYREIFEDIS